MQEAAVSQVRLVNAERAKGSPFNAQVPSRKDQVCNCLSLGIPCSSCVSPSSPCLVVYCSLALLFLVIFFLLPLLS